MICWIHRLQSFDQFIQVGVVDLRRLNVQKMVGIGVEILVGIVPRTETGGKGKTVVLAVLPQSKPFVNVVEIRPEISPGQGKFNSSIGGVCA